MLGIESTSIGLAYILSILSAIGCVIYGICFWNKGAEEINIDDKKWVKEEKELEKDMKKAKADLKSREDRGRK